MRVSRNNTVPAGLYKSIRSKYYLLKTTSRGLFYSPFYREKKSDSQQKLDGEAIANGSNASYMDQLYTKWARDPESVDASWNEYFSEKPHTSRGVSKERPSRKKRRKSEGPGVCGGGGPSEVMFQPKVGVIPPTVKAPEADWKYIDDHLTVQAIIRAYQSRGHLAADLDPLGIVGPSAQLSQGDRKLEATKAVLCQHFYYQFNDLNAIFKLPSSTRIGGNEEYLPLQEILNRLERAYCGHIGVEYMSITSFRKTQWIREQFETPGAIDFTPVEKKLILERLTRSTGFENFLAKKFVSEKRFGLEGCDILIPVMKEIVDTSSLSGVKSVLIGMAHRGRLNVLCNICRKPIVDLMTQFHGLQATDQGSGDVKYHLGLQITRLNRMTQKNIRYTLVANPSHLEFVNPVVQGKARAEMEELGDTNGSKVMPILIHGDASFCGQGVVYESIHMSDLPAYTNHGTIHIVANNQIGFTTDPRFSRSSRYCTDVARVVNAPIFHANADDPEACVYCARVAAKWRALFHKDVVIDLVGYRRNGHNETDEPMFTQPLMYQRIHKMKTVTLKYAEQLVRDGVIVMEDYNEMNAKYEKICNDAYEESKKKKDYKHSDWLDSPWTGFFQGRDRLKICPTGVDPKVLDHIGKIYYSPPPDYLNFVVHRGITRILEGRKKMLEEGTTDWSLGEAFAIGTLVKDKVHVRLSGQDVERGTFSHRHHVLHHQTEDATKYNSLQHLYPDQAAYDVSNSSLSECAIMGFDLGYSMANPNTLVIWEAQFGDFANTAQPIIDTFIASGETKWVRQSALCLFLPHSMEGMGPEHSSGRIERFLQLSDDDESVHPDIYDPCFVARQLMSTNWIITNLTTPANLFHAMRRQMALGFRKPMVNFSPKSLLRHPLARSPLKDYNECSCFHRVIFEDGPASQSPSCVKKLVFCSGKVYYDLFKERDDHEQTDSVALTRIEQLCPFPYDLVEQEMAKYKDAELFWAQEEHKNQAAWTYVHPRFVTALKHIGDCRSMCYLGRAPNSASSTGNKAQHYKEQNDFIMSVFGPLTEGNKKRMEDITKQKREAALKKSEDSLAKAKSGKGGDKPKQAGPPGDKPKKSQKPDETEPPVASSDLEEKPKQASSTVNKPDKSRKPDDLEPPVASLALEEKPKQASSTVTKPDKSRKPDDLEPPVARLAYEEIQKHAGIHFSKPDKSRKPEESDPIASLDSEEIPKHAGTLFSKPDKSRKPEELEPPVASLDSEEIPKHAGTHFSKPDKSRKPEELEPSVASLDSEEIPKHAGTLFSKPDKSRKPEESDPMASMDSEDIPKHAGSLFSKPDKSRKPEELEPPVASLDSEEIPKHAGSLFSKPDKSRKPEESDPMACLDSEDIPKHAGTLFSMPDKSRKPEESDPMACLDSEDIPKHAGSLFSKPDKSRKPEELEPPVASLDSEEIPKHAGSLFSKPDKSRKPEESDPMASLDSEDIPKHAGSLFSKPDKSRKPEELEPPVASLDSEEIPKHADSLFSKPDKSRKPEETEPPVASLKEKPKQGSLQFNNPEKSRQPDNSELIITLVSVEKPLSILVPHGVASKHRGKPDDSNKKQRKTDEDDDSDNDEER